MWWAVGNLGLWGVAEVVRAPASTSYRFENYANEPVGAPVQVVFGEGWDLPKDSWQEYWRWTYDRAELDFNVSNPDPVRIDLTFQLRAAEPMDVAIGTEEAVLWEGGVDEERRLVRLEGLVVNAPRLRLIFAPTGEFEGGQPLFNVRNLRVAIYPLDTPAADAGETAVEETPAVEVPAGLDEPSS